MPVAPERRPPPWLPRAVLLIVGLLFLTALALWILLRVRTLVYITFIALFLAIALEPGVQRLSKRGWKRRKATVVVFIIAVVLGLGFLGSIIPIFIVQAASLVENIPQYLASLQTFLSRFVDVELVDPDLANQFEDLGEILQNLGGAVAGGIFALGNTIFGFIFQAATALLFAYYLVADGPRWRRSMMSMLPPERQMEALRIWEVAVEKTGAYTYSRLILAVVAGAYTFIVLLILGVPYAAAHAVWVGVLSQFVPVIGTYIALVIPALAAFFVNPLTALWVILALILYQQIENYWIAPRITERTMAIHPAVSIAAVIAGASLLGGVGAVLALPVTAIIQALVSATINRHELVESDHVVDDSFSV
ncbi:MAG TPA: AI-2E family transporter [Acidimicrobiia bacterium]|nr:AI-2E family transporter [Acidimicrobiia bacterium]